LIGIASVLIAPVVYVILSYAVPFVEPPGGADEHLLAPGGLTNRWAIKAVIVHRLRLSRPCGAGAVPAHLRLPVRVSPAARRPPEF
jgi:hypothetical protein